MAQPKRKPVTNQWLSSQQEKPVRNGAVADDVSGSTGIEQNSPIEPAPGFQRLGALWPAVWLALAGVATLGWLIGIVWAAVKFVRWLID
jgi:hypothetical protein